MRFWLWALPIVIGPPLASWAQTNLVANPGFENGQNPWELLDYASSIVTTPTHTGSRALSLLNDAGPNHNVRQSPILGIQGGREYVFSVWVAGENVEGIGSGGKPLAVLAWLDSAGQRLRREMYMWAPYTTYGYRQMSIASEAPADAIKARIMFRSWFIEAGGASEGCTGGTTFWDDIELTPRVVAYDGATLLETYQAEATTTTWSLAHTASSEEGFTGDGYVAMEDTGAYLEWHGVNTGAGARLLSFRYAKETGTLSCDVRLNGTPIGSLQFGPTGSPNSWATTTMTANLLAGDNTIRLRVGAGFMKPSLDALLVYGTAASTNQPPEVAIVAPADGSIWQVGDTVTITANASDTDGVVTGVELLVDGVTLGTMNTPPFSWSWIAAGAGNVTLSARATDDDGESSLSPAVTIDIQESDCQSSGFVCCDACASGEQPDLASGCAGGHCCTTCVVPTCPDGICDAASESCGSCPRDCPLATGEVCCDGVAQQGSCCLDSECPRGAECVAFVCTPSSTCPEGDCDAGAAVSGGCSATGSRVWLLALLFLAGCRGRAGRRLG